MSKLIDIIEEDAERVRSKVDLSCLTNKIVMITGASGLIGTNLIASLKDSHAIVIAVVQHLPIYQYKHAIYYTTDLTQDFSCYLPKADYIIHAAGYGQPSKYMADPIKTIKLNTTTTMQLFEKLNPNGKFIFISSSEVYSGLTDLCTESQIGTTNTDHPRACYIEGKRCAEAITLINKGKVVRLSLAYGPGTKPDDSRALNQFIKQAINGRIDLLDDGSAIRTCCYVSDAIELIWQVLLNGKESIYNIAGESSAKILYLAKKIGFYMNVPVYIPAESHRLSGSPNDVCVDITKVKEEFGKTDFISLGEGLKRTIEYQKELYKCV